MVKDKKYQIVVDEYHGETLFSSRARRELRRTGFNIEPVTEAYDMGLLSDADVLIIWFTRYNLDNKPQFTAEELSAIHQFLEQGGALFLIGLGWVWKQYEGKSIDQYPLNLIAEPYGIFFTEATIPEVNGVSYEEKPVQFYRPNFAEHAITTNIERVGASDSLPGSLIVDPPAIPLIWGSDETMDSDKFRNPPILATNEVAGLGRLVCLQHASYVVNFEFDNLLLLQNILNWLIGKEIPLMQQTSTESIQTAKLSSPAATPQPRLDLKSQLELGQAISRYFNEDELDWLSLSLNVDPEILKDDTKLEKAVELVAYMNRRNGIDDLLSKLVELRPKVPEYAEWLNRN